MFYQLCASTGASTESASAPTNASVSQDTLARRAVRVMYMGSGLKLIFTQFSASWAYFMPPPWQHLSLLFNVLQQNWTKSCPQTWTNAAWNLVPVNTAAWTAMGATSVTASTATQWRQMDLVSVSSCRQLPYAEQVSLGRWISGL